MTDRGALLQSVCEYLVNEPALRPVYDKAGKLLKTFCNLGVRSGAQRLGCGELDDAALTMEAMIALIRANKSGRWKIVDGRSAAIHALGGGLAVAFMDKARLEDPHAHGAIVWPEAMQRSGSLGHDVPFVANVGKGDPAEALIDLPDGTRTRKNVKCLSSRAFPVVKGEAEYAIWT